MIWSFQFTFDIVGLLIFGVIVLRFCYFFHEGGIELAVRRTDPK